MRMPSRTPVLLATSLLACLVLYFAWQAFVFLHPRPRPHTLHEVEAITAACRQAAARVSAKSAGPARFGVAHFGGDGQDVATLAMRDALAARAGWSVVAGSPVRRFLSDVARSVSDATSLDEVVHAGRRVQMDVIVAGRLLAAETTNGVGRAAINVQAYDVRQGAWLLRDTITAEWRPSLSRRLALRFRGLPWPWRVALWLAFAGLLPWATRPLTRRALARRSNAVSAGLLLLYTLADLLVGAALRGFAPAGGGWGGFAVAFLVCGAYNFWACERIAGGE